jgi:hypothetical protein
MAVSKIDKCGRQTILLNRKAVSTNSSHTLSDNINNYDAFVITVHNSASAGSGQNTYVTRQQLTDNPMTLVASLVTNSGNYVHIGVTSISGTTLSVGFVNQQGITPYMSVVGIKY